MVFWELGIWVDRMSMLAVFRVQMIVPLFGSLGCFLVGIGLLQKGGGDRWAGLIS